MFIQPPGGVARRRELIYDRFLSLHGGGNAGEQQAVLRRYVLAALFNADLEGPVLHHCVWGCCASYDDTLEKMCRFGVAALLPCKAPKPARTRWTGQQLFVQWSGLLEAHHGLMHKVVAKFTGGPVTEAATASARAEQASAMPVSDLDDEGVDECGAAYMALAAAAPPDEHAAPSHPDGPGEEPHDEARRWKGIDTRKK